MKSAISIELDGTTFSLDERAYAALRSYLDRAGERLGTHPDRAEVVAGLERSIAAKLRQRGAANGGAVVDEATMLAALKEVGRVDGPALHDSPSSGAASQRERRARKLYRLRQGHWIAGVCTGLAAYARVDVVLIRLIFVLVGVFSGGIAILVYVALAFVMPLAVTDAEIAEAHDGTR
jgi:phage shock protein PspC (stress-responsive transcriptional regulator)